MSVDVVLPLEEVLRPLDDLCGVMEELPLVELLGDVVLDMVRKADGTVLDLLGTEAEILYDLLPVYRSNTKESLCINCLGLEHLFLHQFL